MGSRALVCSGLGSGLERVMLQKQTHKAFWSVRVYSNCIGFGSGVLPGFGGFCFCFCNLIFGSGGRFFFLLWNLILESWGRLAGFAFCFCFLAGLGWAAAGLGRALLTHV